MHMWKPAAVVALAVGVAVVGAPTATADPHLAGATFALPHNPVPCGAGVIEYGMSSGNPSGYAIVGLHATFVGLGPALHVSCTVNATLHWHNETTGADGSFVVPLRSEAPYGAVEWFQPGPGQIVATVTTDTPHFVQRAATAPIR